VTAIMMQLAF